MIKIQNIYYMLSYAFKELNITDFKSFESESFDNHADLCAEILINAVNRILKTGIKRDYITYSEFMKFPRGKIELQETISSLSFLKPQIKCSHDEYSENFFLNQLIKSTFKYLLKLDIQKDRKKKITQLLRFFSDVDDISLREIKWRRYRCNFDVNYNLVLFICELVYKVAIVKVSDSTCDRLQSFFTEDALHKIYEHFILGFYRKEFKKELYADAPAIAWNLDYGSSSYLLPKMQSDILIRNKQNDNVLIIDAKFYNKILQNRYDKDSARSNNLYQIFTYTKNYEANYPSRAVSGMLLYAKTEEELCLDEASYSMSGNKIFIRTLDLNQDFKSIKQSLINIASLIL